MKKLVSEQLPNDGGWHADRLVREANEKLNQIGRRGKRAKIVAKKSSLSLQFSFKDGKGNPQKNVGLGAIPLSAKGIEEAEKIAQLVTGQLVAGTFTWDWFNGLIGKDTSEQAKVLTCKEMVEVYKKHYFKQREDNKSPDADWKASYRHIEKKLNNTDKPLSLSLIRDIVNCTKNNTFVRRKTLNGLTSFLKYFDNDDYKSIIKEYKANNKPKNKPRNVPSDKRIIEIYREGFEPKPRASKKYSYRCPQWQFLYSLLATYGLRVHEAWSIANWDKPVTLKNGDWVIVEDSEENEESKQHQGENMIVPAMLDSSNKDYILCIKHDTKTGYRMAFPLSPEGHDWVREFDLLQPLNLPDVKEPKKKAGTDESVYECTRATCQWFRGRKYGFKPHDLRHAYNHRGHRLEVNLDALCQSMGHSYEMNTTTYRNSKRDEVKLEDMLLVASKDKEKRSEIELLKSKVETLTNENAILKNEIEILRAKLQIESLLAKE